MVVAQLARLGGETEVRNVGDRGGRLDVEALRPLVLVLVLELELELLVLEVGEAELGGGRRVAETPGRAPCQLDVLAVVVLVVALLTVAVHRHNIGEDHSGAVVLVSVDKDTQTLESIGAAKDRAAGGALLGDPHGKSVAIELVLAGDLELDFNLPVRRRQGHAREHPSGLRRAVGGKSDVATPCQPIVLAL